MRLRKLINEDKNASAVTKKQEGLHALIFAAKQKKKKIGMDILKDPDLLQSAYDAYTSVDIPFGDLYNFAQQNPSWLKSVIEAANVTFNSGYLKGKYTFHRDDALMKSIYTQFKKLKAKEGIKMGNDKWNPGDIWASKGSVSIPEFETLAEYNEWISKMLKAGKLIGISLKKIKGTGTVKLEGDITEEPQEPRKFMGVAKPRNIYPTGVRLLADKDTAINFRSFRVSKEADIAGEILKAGSAARHGKVPASRKKEMIKKYGISQMSKAEISKSSDEDLQNYVLELWANVGYVFSEADIAKYIKQRGKKISNRTGYWQSIIHSLQIADFMSSNKAAANKIMDYWYKGAKSATKESSQFIKVY